MSACPGWCSCEHDRSDNDGEHHHTLADNSNDLVFLDASDFTPAVVQIWLGGNPSFTFPLRDDGAEQLREFARLMDEAATALEKAVAT